MGNLGASVKWKGTLREGVTLRCGWKADCFSLWIRSLASTSFSFSRADGVVDNSEARGLLRTTKDGFGKRGNNHLQQ